MEFLSENAKVKSSELLKPLSKLLKKADDHYCLYRFDDGKFTLNAQEHFAHPNEIGNKGHRIPETILHAFRAAPGKDYHDNKLSSSDALVNLCDKARQAVKDGAVEMLNDLYYLNAEQLSAGNQSGASSRIIKQLSAYAGVLSR